MKAKVVVSFGAVIGLAVLSVVAFMSTAGTIPVGTVSEQGMAVKTFIIREEPVEVLEKSILPTEPMVESEVHEEPQSSGDDYLLAKIAMAEAEGEGTEGKALVILVVLNRVWSDGFPDTIEEVLFQRTSGGGWQFSPMQEGGRWYTTEPNEDCYAALDLIMKGWDESYGALYFESSKDPTWHSEHLEFLFKVGNHKFYR